MKTFGDLFSFINEEKAKGKIFTSRGKLGFQIFESTNLEFNISVGKYACLKVEQYSPRDFKVAVSKEPEGSILHSARKIFRREDELVKLLEAFPTGYKTDFIVEELTAY